jgi:hypothetical protein
VVVRDALAQLPDVSVCRTGSAAGTVCSPNGVFIPGASITAQTEDCFGGPRTIEVRSDLRGFFRLEDLTPGFTEVTIQTGTFIQRFGFEAVADEEVSVSGEDSAKVCLSSDSAGLAVLRGDYDDIGGVIDELGFEFVDVCGSWGAHRAARELLSDYRNIDQFDIIFVNCATGIDLRATNPEVDLIKENMRRFVSDGGSLYVSDLAADFIEQLWPDYIDFVASNPRPYEAEQCCVCVDCPPECILEDPTPPSSNCPEPNPLPENCREPRSASGRGEVGVVEAHVISPFLQQYLETDSFPIDFNAGGWVQIESVSAEVEVLVQSDDRPLMVLFEPGERGGRVAYTSFHNHVQASDSMLAILRALIFRL